MSEEIASGTAGETGQELTEKVLVDVSKLTPQQMKALHGMQCGRPLNHIAQLAGVSRQTLHNWRNHDEAFKAAVSKTYEALLGNVQNQVVGLAQGAVHAIDDAINQGNPWIALEILRQLRCFPVLPAPVPAPAAAAVVAEVRPDSSSQTPPGDVKKCQVL